MLAQDRGPKKQFVITIHLHVYIKIIILIISNNNHPMYVSFLMDE